MDEREFATGATSATLAALRRRWRLVLLCVVLLPALALLISLTRQKQYTATSDLTFKTGGPLEIVLGGSAEPATGDPARIAATNVAEVASPDVAVRTARALGGRLTGREVTQRVRVAGKGATDIVSISAKTGDPRFAARLANVYAEQFIALDRDTARADALAARSTIENRLNRLPASQQTGRLARTMRDRLVQLDIVASASPTGINISQHASPSTSPSSPKPARNVAFGVALGLLVGLAVALIAEYFDDRITDADEIPQFLDLPVLGEVPESNAFVRRPGSMALRRERAREAIRMVRARMPLFADGRAISSVLFTSCASGDGRSTIASQFAASAAATGVRTILVDADLRNPSLAVDTGLRPAPGLADVLQHRVGLREVVQHVDVSTPDQMKSASAGRDGLPLAVIPAGDPPLTAPELLTSERMSHLLGGLAADYQLVVLDTPSALEVSDAIPLMSQVDCVVVVVRVGRTSRQAAHRLRQLLSEARSPVMVAVANRVRHRRHVSSAYRRRSPATTAARRLDAAQGATVTRNGGAT